MSSQTEPVSKSLVQNNMSGGGHEWCVISASPGCWPLCFHKCLRSKQKGYNYKILWLITLCSAALLNNCMVSYSEVAIGRIYRVEESWFEDTAIEDMPLWRNVVVSLTLALANSKKKQEQHCNKRRKTNIFLVTRNNLCPKVTF